MSRLLVERQPFFHTAMLAGFKVHGIDEMLPSEPGSHLGVSVSGQA